MHESAKQQDNQEAPSAEVLETYRQAWGASPVDAEAEAGLRDNIDRMAAEVDRIATERGPGVAARITESLSKGAS